MHRPTLSTADVAALCAWPLRRAQRAMVRWERRGYPRVVRVPGVGRGGQQLRVDRAELLATLAGALTPDALAA